MIMDWKGASSRVVTLQSSNQILSHIVTAIAERFEPQRIVLFGSQAREEADGESDFDLFVEMTSDLSPPERAALISSIFGLRSWSLDLIVYTPAEVQQQRELPGSLIHEIESEGKLVYERR